MQSDLHALSVSVPQPPRVHRVNPRLSTVLRADAQPFPVVPNGGSVGSGSLCIKSTSERRPAQPPAPSNPDWGSVSPTGHGPTESGSHKLRGRLLCIACMRLKSNYIICACLLSGEVLGSCAFALISSDPAIDSSPILFVRSHGIKNRVYGHPGQWSSTRRCFYYASDSIHHSRGPSRLGEIDCHSLRSMVGRLACIGSSCKSRSIATDTVLMVACSSSLSCGHCVRWAYTWTLSATENTFKRSKVPRRRFFWCRLSSSLCTIPASL